MSALQKFANSDARAFLWEGNNFQELIDWCRAFGDNIDYFFFNEPNSTILVSEGNSYKKGSLVVRYSAQKYSIFEPLNREVERQSNGAKITSTFKKKQSKRKCCGGGCHDKQSKDNKKE